MSALASARRGLSVFSAPSLLDEYLTKIDQRSPQKVLCVGDYVADKAEVRVALHREPAVNGRIDGKNDEGNGECRNEPADEKQDEIEGGERVDCRDDLEGLGDAQLRGQRLDSVFSVSVRGRS